MKEKLIYVGVGALIGAITASIVFIILVNAKGLGKRHNFVEPPQMKQSQDFRRENKGKQVLPNGQKQNSNDGSSTNVPSQDQQTQTQPEQTQTNS